MSQGEKFTIYETETGKVLYGGFAFNPASLLQPGQSILIGHNQTEGWVEETGRINQLPERPSLRHEFDYNEKRWKDPRTLDDLKAEHWERIKRNRNSAEAAGFPYLGKVFDSDTRSAQRIAIAAQAASAALAAGQPFSVKWKTADNTSIDLDAQQMLGVPVALAQHAAAQHTQAALLLEQIELATTAEELDAIVWPE